tara:strand:- start:1806 stop:4049 length:2244 start_codon:yes stop_codon:yes gene_type:complete
MAERESIESIGESLLSQQRSRQEKADKRRRKDQKKLMVLGTLIAGQSLVNSALKRRMTEMKDNNELNMINSKLYHKKIQTAAQLYDPFEQNKITDFDSAYGSEKFQNDFDKIYSPIYERQLKSEGGDKVLSAGDKIRHYELYKADQIKNLLANQKDWSSGIKDFGVSNKQLGLGSEADLNIQLTKKSKELQRNMGGSIFDINNLRSLLTVGRKREGSVWDKKLSEVNSLQGLQKTVTNLGLDKAFQESYTNFRNTSMRWDDKGDEATQTSMINSLQDLEARLRKGDVLLKRDQTLRPFATEDLPSYTKYREKIAGGVRMGEFNAYLNDSNNGFFKEQFLRNSTGLYLKFRDERGFKEEFLKDILKLDPASDEYRQMESNLNDDITLRLFSNSYTIQQLVTDRSGDDRLSPFAGEEFTIDTRPFDKLLRPKIEITSKGFQTTKEFSNASVEEKKEAFVDEINKIVNTPMDPIKKSELIEIAFDTIPVGIPKDELRALVQNQLLGIRDDGRLPPFFAVDKTSNLGFGMDNLGVIPEDTLAQSLGQKKNLINPLPSQITRATNLGIITTDIDQNVVESKFKKLLDFTSYAESRNRNNQVSSEGAIGYFQFLPNKVEGKQNSLNTAYNRLSRELGIINVDVPQELIRMAEQGFVSLDNVSKESQSLLALSNYIEDTPFDIRTGERLSGQGSTIIKAYLKAAPGSVEERQALEFLYYNVHHKPKKEGVGLTEEELKPIIENFEKSYNKYYKL